MHPKFQCELTEASYDQDMDPPGTIADLQPSPNLGQVWKRQRGSCWAVPSEGPPLSLASQR